MIKLSEASQKYLEHFYEPEFTSYDFIFLFSTINALQNNYSFSRDNLLKTIENCKSNNEYNDLLEEIKLKSNGIHSYSEELEEAITKLKYCGILYTISPEQDSTIFIVEKEEFFKKVQLRKDQSEEMTKFISKYNDMNNKKFVKTIYNK